MKDNPVIVFPIHDPTGIIFPHLWRITPLLKNNFSHCFAGVTPDTLHKQKREIDKLKKDRFFNITYYPADSLIGDHFIALYRKVAEICSQETTVHLVTEDRLVFALTTKFREPALRDFRGANKEKGPVIFQRSEKAWNTHPKNYWAAESMITQAGKILFGKSLDFTWCHLVLKVARLRRVLPQIESHDLTVIAEIAFHLRNEIKTRDVDWLAWEDPFILGKDPWQFKREREQSKEETEKRLGYAIPIIKMLFNKYFLLRQTSKCGLGAYKLRPYA